MCVIPSGNPFSTSIGRGGKLALGQVLRKNPLRSAGFALEGVRLCECWDALDLPAEGADWEDSEVVAYFRARSEIAFASVSHARLGQASVWSGLDSNLIWIILRGRNG